MDAVARRNTKKRVKRTPERRDDKPDEAKGMLREGEKENNVFFFARLPQRNYPIDVGSASVAALLGPDPASADKLLSGER